MSMSKELKDQKKPSDAASKEEASLMSFGDWFTAELERNKRLKAHHYHTILAYCKSHGLSEAEASSEYDKALKKFGY